MVNNLPQPVFINTSHVEINKVRILDSGCNYSALSTLENNDLDLQLELSDTLEW